MLSTQLLALAPAFGWLPRLSGAGITFFIIVMPVPPILPQVGNMGLQGRVEGSVLLVPWLLTAPKIQPQGFFLSCTCAMIGCKRHIHQANQLILVLGPHCTSQGNALVEPPELSCNLMLASPKAILVNCSPKASFK